MKSQGRRTTTSSTPRPCDQCRQRKVLCDKSLPSCRRCSDIGLPCTREVVRQRPGRKRGTGNVIKQLRSPQTSEFDSQRPGNAGPERKLSYDADIKSQRKSVTTSPLQDVIFQDQADQNINENLRYLSFTPRSIRSESYGSPATTGSILTTIPNLDLYIDLFFTNLYPIWPVIDEAAFRESLKDHESLDRTQECLILSICALAVLHIPGTASPTGESRPNIAVRLIKTCLAIRAGFDYLEHATIATIQTSLFLSCAEVEVPLVRSSYFLLRESIILAQELGFYERVPHIPERSASETLSIDRTLYLLSLVERGLTLLRNKPYAIIMLDSPSSERYPGEDPRVLYGLQCLSRLFSLLDKTFLDTWVLPYETGNPAVEVQVLAAQQELASLSFDVDNMTDIQKADILIAQQWLRLVFWQLSMRQGLLSTRKPDPLSYQFPREIAKSLLAALELVSMDVLFIHGMAIFERMFEIIFNFIDILIMSASLSSEVDSLQRLFRVLREAPNIHRKYTQILETKILEAKLVDGEAVLLRLRGETMVA